MSTVGFILADATPGGHIPETVELPLASGYAEAQGALLLVNGSDQYAACGANPAAVAAVALTPGGTDTSGFNILGHKEFPAGYMQGILVANNVRFNAPFIGTLPANAGGQYGVVRDSDGVWKVDFTDTTTKVVNYVGQVNFNPSVAAASQPLVLVTFIASVVQPAV